MGHVRVDGGGSGDSVVGNYQGPVGDSLTYRQGLSLSRVSPFDEKLRGFYFAFVAFQGFVAD